ncbi:MAG: coenzyme F420-0:L-glutamate ligase [Clostridiales bacterium]|nr:coenzyme F420-0:L-glutamate ligase [Clostridiales bacterium]
MDDAILARSRATPLGGVVRDSVIAVGGKAWRRLTIKTHVILEGEDIVEVTARYVRPHLQEGDIVFVSEKAVAGSQGRSVPIAEVKPRPLARFLASKVRKVPWGFGLSKPETMELAIREAGVLRILLAAAVHVLGRPFGRSGDFYRVAGRRVAAIDGPTAWTQPPYNTRITLAPLHPHRVAEAIAARLREETGFSRIHAAVVDVNDLGSEILGASRGAPRNLIREALRDNPLGQGPYQTPLGILREA